MEDDTLDITIAWNMWWGVNGDFWSLRQNEEIVFTESLMPWYAAAAKRRATIQIYKPGIYTFIVELCLGPDLCASGVPFSITVTGYTGKADYVSPSCSSILQEPGEFASIFTDFNGEPSSLSGDLNNDDAMDILDVLILVNMIISG